MKVVLGSDHAGFKLKEVLKQFLTAEGYEVEDVGPHEFDKLDDYPDFCIPAAEKVASEGCMGIVLGHSGQGEAFSANKVRGIRAVVYNGGSEEIITLTREHNDSNVLSFGAHFIEPDQAKKLAKMWLETPFTNEERHARRIKKVSDYEN